MSRTWSAPKAGVINITGQASLDAVTTEVEGVEVTITHNDQPIFGPRAVTDNVGIPTAASNISVAAGDVIRFIVQAVDPNDPAGLAAWMVLWDPTIAYQ
jgi:hypothetical protein